MTFQLSILDKCPVLPGETPVEALKNAVLVAKAAEDAGFNRFWVAEHHHTPDFASSAPEVLVAFLLASTKKIRIGSGGVMLQHYSPYKVAEVFNLLATLAPHRVDMGIGKTPGGLPSSTAALQLEFKNDSRLSFLEKVQLLRQFLGGNKVEKGAFNGVSATPRPSEKAQGFLLGASIASAQLAADLEWELSYAGHLNGNDQNLKDTFTAYSELTGGKVPLLALAAVVGSNDEEAKARANAITIFKIHFSDQTSFSLSSQEAAEEFAKQSGRSDYVIEEHKTQVLSGTAQSVIQDLAKLHQKYSVREFMLEFPGSTLNERLFAIEALAKAKKQLSF